eukprot:g2940.t1
MEARSCTDFVEGALRMARSCEGSIVEAFQGNELMLEQFWILATSVEKAYFESTAVQLGFGLCEAASPPSGSAPIDSLRKRAAIANLSKPAFSQPKKSKKSATEASSSSTPLLDREKSEKKKWAARLEEIGLRAGAHAKLFSEFQLGPELSAAEKIQLRNLVLVSGAHRTMACHITTFERFERWASAFDWEFYPLTTEKVVKYGLFLNDRLCGPSVLPTLRASVKWAAVISDRAKTLKEAVPVPIEVLALRQIFGRQRLSEGLCRAVADRKLLTVEAFAMLGDTIAAVKESLKVIIADEDLLGSTAGERELALTSLAAVWKTCSTLQDHFAARRAKMEEDPSKVPEIPGDDHAEFREQFVSRHPDVLLPHHREPHRKLVERLQRDFLVHGSVPFYEVGELRTRSEQIAQKSGLSKNAEDLLKVVTIDQPTSAASEAQVMDKLHAFLVALEYLNICEFTYAAGPLRYLSELEEWRQENHGLALLLSVDSLIRKKVYRLNSDHRKAFGTFSSALNEVLNNHKQLWNDARSSAELENGMAAMASPKSPKSPKAPPMIPGLVNHEMTQKELEEISQQKMDVPSGPAPPAGSNPGVQSQLELLLHKVDVCLTEILNVKSMAGKESENLFGAKKGGKKSKVSWGNFPDSEPSLRQTAIPERQETETYDSAVRRKKNKSMVEGTHQSTERVEQPSKKITQMDPGVELTPMMRLVERSTLEIVWEFLDDQDSSRGAWWACLFLRTVVVVSLLLSLLQNTEEQIMDPVATAVWETSVDVLFVAEFLARVISSPYKRTYFLDPFNWADMLTVLALPLRISTGFVLESSPVSPAEDAVHVILKFAVPLVRFLKLLRCSDLKETLAGYLVVSFLSFVSVLFLALPVGIIGHEFTASWNSRHKVLLITKVRKCLEKWGYSAKDVKEYVKAQQEKLTPVRKSRAVAGMALQHLEHLHGRPSQVRASRLSDQ